MNPVYRAAAECIDTGKGPCQPEWAYDWLWLGAVFACVAAAAYWRYRTKKVQRVASIVGESPEELRTRLGRPRILSRRGTTAVEAFLVLTLLGAAYVGWLRHSAWLAICVVTTVWAVGFAAAIVYYDWWLVTYDVKRHRADR